MQVRKLRRRPQIKKVSKKKLFVELISILLLTIAVTIESILNVYILRNNRSKKKSTYISAKT